MFSFSKEQCLLKGFVEAVKHGQGVIFLVVCGQNQILFDEVHDTTDCFGRKPRWLEGVICQQELGERLSVGKSGSIALSQEHREHVGRWGKFHGQILDVVTN